MNIRILSITIWVLVFSFSSSSAAITDKSSQIQESLNSELEIRADSPENRKALLEAYINGDSEALVNLEVTALYETALQQKAQKATPSSLQKSGEFVGTPTDEPLFGELWHITNNGSNGGKRGEDINVLAAWDQGYSGQSKIIGFIDSAVEGTHPDLGSNYRFDLSFDFAENDDTPWEPGITDSSGTAVAGLAVAADNDIGIIGVAYEAHFTSLRLLEPADTDSANAPQVFTHENQNIDIYNIGFGYDSNSINFKSLPDASQAAIMEGITNGRDGLGSIYVVAGGNDRGRDAMTNYFALTSSPYTIAVGSVDNTGNVAGFSNPGSTLFVSAPSSGTLVGLTTTDATADNGYVSTNYISDFSGTSASASMVSGVIALMLEANSGLSWRDVRHVLANTAFPINPGDEGWQENGAGFFVNHDYGFGRVDATAAIAGAMAWQSVGNLVNLEYTNSEAVVIPDNDETGVTSTIQVTENIILENVEITVVSDHTYWGDLIIRLKSPSGTISEITQANSLNNNQYGEWTFSTVFNWGEESIGEWEIFIEDEFSNDTGSLNSWTLKLSGTEITDTTNQRPVAENDLVIVQRGSENIVDIFSNDSEPDGDPLNPISFYQPAFGTLVYDAEGNLVYTPNENFGGVDSFGYTLMDSQGSTDKAIVTLNDVVPFANQDQVVTQMNTSTEFDPIFNDVDVNENQLSVESIGDAANGSVALSNINNDIVFTPDQDFRGHNQFNYVVTDNTDGTDTGLVNVFVTESDDFAALLPGSNEYVITLSNAFTQNTGFSYECWFYPLEYAAPDSDFSFLFSNNSIAIAVIKSQFTDANARSLVLLAITEDLDVVDFIAPADIIDLNKWQHLAVTYAPITGFKMYLDGVEVALTPGSTETLDPGALNRGILGFIGNTGALRTGFRGLVDDFRYWDISRTQDQINTSMNGLADEELGPLSPLLAYFKFDEGREIFVNDISRGGAIANLRLGLWSPKDVDLIQYQVDNLLNAP